MKRSTSIKLVLLIDLVIIFILLCLIKNNTVLAEDYSMNVASKYISFMSKLTSLIPFSLYEFTLIFLIVAIIWFIGVIFIKLAKKEYKHSFQKLVSFILFILISTNYYFATASISYGRSKVMIPQYEQEVTNELIDETFNYFLNDYNNIARQLPRNEDGTIISPYTFEQINNLIANEYEKLDPSSFSSFTPRAKKLIFSNIFSELHFTGVFWAPSGEANINYNIHDAELPHTMAHEFAHSKGVFREDDANLVAMYITLNSDNIYLRYSGYYSHFSSLLRIYQQTNYDKYVENYFKLDENIRKEYKTISDYWSNHDLLSKLGRWYNDLFLKLNGSKNGVQDYSDNTTSEDSGETDDNNKPIYIIKEHSPYSKLFFFLYLEAKNK